MEGAEGERKKGARATNFREIMFWEGGNVRGRGGGRGEEGAKANFTIFSETDFKGRNVLVGMIDRANWKEWGEVFVAMSTRSLTFS